MEKNNNENISNNLEVINTNLGRIKFNKTFFKVCGAIGLVATGVGIAGLAVIGLTATLPLVTTSLGAATMATSVGFHLRENKYEDEQIELKEENEYLYTKNRTK